MRIKKLLSFLLALSMILSLLPVSAIAEEIEDQPAHEHSYVAVETVDATCTEQGYTVYTCECGDSYTDYTEALGHAWDEGVVTLEPTAETEGEMTYTCSRCGEVQTEAIAVLNPEDPDVDPEGEDPEKTDEEDADAEESEDPEDPEDPDKEDEDADKKDEEEDEAELKAANATAPTGMWVELPMADGTSVKTTFFATQTSGGTNRTYTGQLFFPGNVVLENCFLSWDGDMQATVTVNGQSQTFNSGECPVPTPSEGQKTYTFRSGNTTRTFRITSYQGSASVVPVFIEIDESQGTIAAMDRDKNNVCTGMIYIDGVQYVLDKMKGRGNATWTTSRDKKPYNITLGSKINFPGVDSQKTKKWSFLCEVTDHSLLCNRVGYQLAYEMGIGQDTASADVWMNGEYQGCYTVTPKTDSFVSDDGFMIEQDNYIETEDPQFTLDGLISTIEGDHTSSYNRITVKKAGDTLIERAGSLESAAYEISLWLQDALNAILSDTGYNDKGKYYTDYIDIESFAKMYLLHEYVKSYDVCAGSILFHRESMNDSDKLIAGPAWDLDNAMGATCDDYLGSNVDRRRGDGSFIENINEYKTSIYKNIYKHEDFVEEVYYQYNKNKAAFNDLPNDVETMKNAIADSARMNHYKVQDISANQYQNTHMYPQKTNLGSAPYEQEYLATTNSKTDWGNYVENLKTYVQTRSLWFANTYTDNSYVDPSECSDHEYIEISRIPATCTSSGVVNYKCSKCRDTKTEIIPKAPHDYQDGFCTVCGEKLLNVTISCDEGASVTVYETQDLNGAYTDNATSANPRDSDSGLIDCSGNGQVNFVVKLKPGYGLANVSANPKDSYKNLKPPSETGVTNGYRITKVTGDFTIEVTTKAIPAFKSRQVVLGGQIGMYYYLTIPDEYVDGSYMEFDIAGSKTTVETSEDLKQKDGRYRFLCNINAVQMADALTATFHYTDNETDNTISNTTSVEHYLDVLIINEKNYEQYEEAKEAAKALNDYGYYSQIAVDTEGAHTPMVKAYKEPAELINTLSGFPVTLSKGDSVISANYSLSLTSETKINLFFETNGLVLSKENTAVSVNDNTTFDYTVEKDGTRYRVQITGINAVELGSTFTITINDGTIVTASALSYVQQVLTTSQTATDEVKHSAAALYSFYDEMCKYYKG